jgi:glyoxylase-like metal-dependent hydrolase (beta-lactamase superfamily II)
MTDAIHHPFAEAPDIGKTIKVSEGVYWARLPLPFVLNHVNVWLLDDGDGWTILDCGVDTLELRTLWKEILQDRRINRIIASHGHPDHMGLARWLVDETDASFVTTQIENDQAVVTYQRSQSAPSAQQMQFLIAHGYSAEEATQRSGFGKTMRPLVPNPPNPDQIIAHDHVIGFGHRQWRVVTAGGHSPEHASFIDENKQVMIVGDQILPRITPFVGVDYRDPDGDPLKTYLNSLALFANISADHLILPGHGLPFQNLPVRLAELKIHHDQRLDQLMDGLHAPQQARELAHLLFPRAMGTGHERLAVSECLAHLNYLMHQNLIHRHEEQDGRILFSQR